MTFFGLRIDLKFGFSRGEPASTLNEVVPVGVVARPSHLTAGPVRLATVDPLRMGFIKYLIEAGAIHD